MAHLWAKWLRHLCRLGDAHRCRAGGKIRSGPLVGKVATSPLPSRGSPPLQSGGKIRSGPLMGKVATSPLPSRGSPPLQSGGRNQKWPTCGQRGYITLAISGIPTAAERVGKSEVAHLWAKWLRHLCRLGDPHRFRAGGGGGSEVAHLWAKWLRHPCRLGDPHRFTASGKIRSGPLVGKVAASPLPSRGSPPFHNRGGEITSGPLVGKVATSPLPARGSPPHQSEWENQKWPTCGQSGYVTPAVSGIPTASERVGKSEVAHLWAKWLRHPWRLGDPHRFRARGGESVVAHLWAKWLRHPWRLGDPHRFRAGGGNQKWPTCGQSGYVTPDVSGIPTASERVGKSEVAHLWAKWLRHPCRLGDPHRFRAGGKIRSGPLVGNVAASPPPSRGSPPLQSGWENQKWPACGQIGYVTPAGSGMATASQRVGKSEVAHLWAKWLRHPCRLGDPHRFTASGKIRSGPLVGKLAASPLPARGSPPLQSGWENQKWPTCGQRGCVTPAVPGIPTASERVGKSEVARLWANWLRHPCWLGDADRFTASGKIRSGPLVGKVATSPLPSRGSPPLHSKWENQKWPTCGQTGCVTPAVSGIPTASQRVGKSEVAHLWAKWLRHPCRLGDPHRFRAGGGGGQKWPTCGQSDYVTPAGSGMPTAAERGAKSEVAHLWAKWLDHPCRLGDPHRFRAGGKSEVAHLWAKWLHHPCRLGDLHRIKAGGEIRSGPLVGKVGTSPLLSRGSHRCRAGGKIRSRRLMGKVATSPLPSRGSTPHSSGGGNQKWPTCGQSGYVTPAVSGIPTAAERGAKSEVARKWAKWLCYPCRLGDAHRCRAGGKIRSGPHVGKVGTSPVPSRGSPPLQSGGGNQKWPASGQRGYATLAGSGMPTAAERGAKSQVAHMWAKWVRHPCRLGDPHRFRAGEEIRSGPQVGKVAMPPLPARGCPPLPSGGQNQKWPTCGQSGYVTPAVSGIPTAAQRGGENQKWPPYGQSGYVTPAVSGIPTALERVGKSEVAHLWAKWLRHPCRLRDPHRCRAGGEIRNGPLVGKVPPSPLPSRGSPLLQSGGQNQKWPTSAPDGYVTPAVSVIPTASERVGKSEVAHLWAKWLRHPCCLGDPHRCTARGGKSEMATLWAKWLRHPCRLGDPHRFRASGKIRSGPLVGKVATSPLPSRGSPPLQSRGGNQKWPTCGQSPSVTLAVSGIPTASERRAKSKVAHKCARWLRHPCRLGDPHRFRAGGKSEVAHLWAKWLRHPCRLGDPHRFTASGKIRSGPLVGKVAASPLPSRGSPPLHSEWENQKWPPCGQSGYVTPAVSGIPTASQQVGKSEVAHLWANWLRHPCRLGDPHRFTASGKIRSGPLVGKVATSPLPSRGSPPLQSGGGGDQKWPTCGQSDYVTPAGSGMPTAAERGAKSEVAHLWAKWLDHPCRLGDPHRFRAGGKSEVAHLWAKWLHHPCRLGDLHRIKAGGEIRSGPLVGKVGTSPLLSRGSHRCRAGGKIRSRRLMGKVATSPLPSRGSTPHSSGGGNQKWPTCGQSGYVTPAVSGIPTAAERGAKSEVARKWAKWLCYPCRLGDAHRCRAGGKIISGPHVGKVGTSPVPSRGSPPLQSGGGNQKWPASGQRGYATLAGSGMPTAAERGAKSQVAHMWAKWVRHPCRLGDPHRFRAGEEIRSGPQVGKVAMPPLPARGCPPLPSGGQNQKWPTCGQSGYVTPAVSGIPTAAQRGGENQKWPPYGQSGYVTPAVSGIPTALERVGKSEVAHLWAKWLRHPCRLRDPHRCRAGGEIRNGPLVGKVATSPLPSRGSPLLQSGGQNQKWPTSAPDGYVTPAVSVIPTASERVGKSEVAHLWAKWLRHPCCLGDPHRCTARGGKSEMATLWAKWLRHPCRLGDPHRFRASGKIRSGPLVGKVATSPLPSRGSPPLQSRGGNQKWPTCGQSPSVTTAGSGIPTASERRAKSKVAHKCARWLRHPCRLGDPHRFRAGGKSEVAHFGQSGYVTPAVSVIPTASERVGKSEVVHLWANPLHHLCCLGDPHRCRARGGKSEMAHLWAKWLRHPCRLGDPHRCRAGGKIKSGPQVRQMATSPLPSR